jgi:3-oxoacyl-[acyl-carrier protein] reductase
MISRLPKSIRLLEYPASRRHSAKVVISPAMDSRTVVITGASRGLGLSIAQAFWDTGANLFLVARSGSALEEISERLRRSRQGGQEIAYVVADLGESETPQRIMAALNRFAARLDVLVNNAAIIGPIGPFAGNDWTEWQRAIQVNLLAPAAICQGAIMRMKEQGGGVILNISGGGATSPRPNFSAYATAKAALVRMSETMAAEVFQYGIRVNCIAPGAMNTEMATAVLRAGPELSGEQEYRRTRDQAGRGATNMEVPAALAVYLASGECAGITGRLISAAWDPWKDLHHRAAELEGSDIYTLRRIVPEDRGQRWDR